jgi:uncharacterized Zn-binding protein involved in type VI secretion
MPNIIVIGDSTSHGGTVCGGSGIYTVNGKQVARKGDPCTCPINGHGPCTIAEGDPTHTIEGIPVAYEGHKTSCGASLIASTTDCGKS